MGRFIHPYFQKSRLFFIAFLLFSFPLLLRPNPGAAAFTVEEQTGRPGQAKSDNSKFRQISDSLLRHRPDSAFAYSLAQVSRSEISFDTLGEAYGRYQLGRCYFEIGKYDLATQSYDQAMELFRMANDGNGEALVLRSLGYLNYNMGNAEAALDYYLSSLKLLEKIELISDKSELYNRLGVVYAKLNLPVESQGYFDKALLLDEYQNDSSSISRTLNNLGFALNLLSRPKEALNYLKESLSIKQHANLGDASICPTLHNIAESFFLLNQPDSAILYSKKSLAIAERLGLRLRKKESAELQAKIYTSTGDFKQAYLSQELFYKTSGDILDQNNALLIKTLLEQQKYDLAEKDNLINQQGSKYRAPFSYTGVGSIASLILLFMAWLVREWLPVLFDIASLLAIIFGVVWLAQSANGILGAHSYPADWFSFLSLLLSALLAIGLYMIVRHRLEK